MVQPGSASGRDKSHTRHTGDGMVGHPTVDDAGQYACIGLGCADYGQTVLGSQISPDLFDVHDLTVAIKPRSDTESPQDISVAARSVIAQRLRLPSAHGL